MSGWISSRAAPPPVATEATNGERQKLRNPRVKFSLRLVKFAHLNLKLASNTVVLISFALAGGRLKRKAALAHANYAEDSDEEEAPNSRKRAKLEEDHAEQATAAITEGDEAPAEGDVATEEIMAPMKYADVAKQLFDSCKVRAHLKARVTCECVNPHLQTEMGNPHPSSVLIVPAEAQGHLRTRALYGQDAAAPGGVPKSKTRHHRHPPAGTAGPRAEAAAASDAGVSSVDNGLMTYYTQGAR